jgi:hypothetical protein
VCTWQGTCVVDKCPTISVNGVCPGGFLCVMGDCPSTCQFDEECATGFKCSGGTCVGPADAGVSIDASTFDARSDAASPPADARRDVAPPGKNPLYATCSVDGDCQSLACCTFGDPQGRRCLVACNLLPLGSPCKLDAQCESGTCQGTDGQEGFCSKTCVMGGDCGVNYYDLLQSKNICTLARDNVMYCFPGCYYDANHCNDYGPNWVCRQVTTDTRVCSL